MARIPLSLVLVFILAASVISTTPLAARETKNQIISRDEQECGFVGNSDIYGLGIRIGLYLQWFSGWLGGVCHLEAASELTDSNAVFSIAIFFATVTIDRTTTHPVEVVILFFMFFGGIFAMGAWNMTSDYSGARNAGSSRKEYTSMFSEKLLDALYVGMFAYSLWFWFVGVNDDFLDSPCGLWVFLFGRIGIVNPGPSPGQKGYMFLSAFGVIAVAYGICLAAYPHIDFPKGRLEAQQQAKRQKDREALRRRSEYYQAGGRPWTARAVRLEFGGATASKGNVVTPDHSKWVNGFLKFFWAALGAVYLVWTILGIEVMLSWNSISGINSIASVGQLVPLVIGIISAINIVIGAIVKFLKIQKPDQDHENAGQALPDIGNALEANDAQANGI